MQRNVTRTTTTGSPAFRTGVTFGIILGIIQIAVGLINTYAKVGGMISLINIIGIIVAIILYLLAGLIAARQTGRVGSGAFAGLWTGVISSILGFIATLLFTYLNRAGLRRTALSAAQTAAGQIHQSVPAITTQTVLGAAIVAGILGILLSILLGLILGAIGGLFGRAFARPVQPAMQEPVSSVTATGQEPAYREYTLAPPPNQQ
jgi:hypothetical protein